MICVLVMTDGRADYLGRMMDSAAEMLSGPITRTVIHDDSGNERLRARLRERYREATVIGSGGRRGFSGAMNNAWRFLAANVTEPWVWHAEDDFLYQRLVPLGSMMDVLELRPYLAQMALRRQAWNSEEMQAGGVVEVDPDAFVERTNGMGDYWLEHRRFFTCNPSLYRRDLTQLGWPLGNDSERRFGRRVFGDPKAQAGYWGRKADGPWVEHIGQHRAGGGY